MFVRVKSSVQGGRRYEYIQICRSYREGRKVRQQVLATLGRREKVVADGSLDKLIEALARHSTKVRVVEKVRRDGLRAHESRTWGPALVFGRLWQNQKVPQILHRLAEERRFEFDPDRTAFALALQRLCEPGSDRQGAAWLRTVECPGFEQIELHHLYRTANSFLCGIREQLEAELYFRDRDLFSQELDLVFLDTTSTFVWRDEQTAMRRRGHSRDRRPELPQMVLCVAVDRHGWPVAWEILPGNTADKTAFVSMIERLRKRFYIRRVVVVADRGMISRGSIQLLADHANAPFDFILGARMRRQKEVSGKVLARGGRYCKVDDNLEVKEVTVDGRRYIVCRNPIEQAKDRQARAAILAKLEDTLQRKGPKAMLRNKGYARFLKISRGSVTIDKRAAEADARLDGKFVLQTNTDLPSDEVARAYKSLWRVERTFRETKSTLEVRPIYHQGDEGCIGHIVACFLALRLEVDLQRRLDERGVSVYWPDLMRDLGRVQAVDVTVDGERYRLRTDLKGSAYQAFRAAGVRPPPVVNHVGPTPTEAVEM